MRTEIDVLLSRIEHEALRAELRSQIGRLQSRRTFGLVFESHLPERVRLREHPLRPGMIAALKGDLDSPGYEVLGIEGDTAVVRKVQSPDGSPLSGEQQSEGSEERLPDHPGHSPLCRAPNLPTPSFPRSRESIPGRMRLHGCREPDLLDLDSIRSFRR